MSKIAKEVAEAEVTAWLDQKKVLPSTRESHEDYINTLISAVEEGVLVRVAETNTFVHKLQFPDLGGDEAFTELKYKSRINDFQLAPFKKGVSPKDADGQFNALVAGLTDQAKGLISKLDSQDKKIATAIAIFFL